MNMRKEIELVEDALNYLQEHAIEKIQFQVDFEHLRDAEVELMMEDLHPNNHYKLVDLISEKFKNQVWALVVEGSGEILVDCDGNGRWMNESFQASQNPNDYSLVVNNRQVDIPEHVQSAMFMSDYDFEIVSQELEAAFPIQNYTLADHNSGEVVAYREGDTVWYLGQDLNHEDEIYEDQDEFKKLEDKWNRSFNKLGGFPEWEKIRGEALELGHQELADKIQKEIKNSRKSNLKENKSDVEKAYELWKKRKS